MAGLGSGSMTGEEFFKFNNGKEFRFSNYKEIKEEDLKGADEKTKKLFNIFAGEDKVLQKAEAKSLFEVLKSVAGENKILEENEISIFTKEKIGEKIDTNIFVNFVNNIFKPEERSQNQSVQTLPDGTLSQEEQTFLEEAACKEIVVDIIDDNLTEAYEILNTQYLGAISGRYDESKDKNDILKTSNVAKVLEYQNAGIEWMNQAKLAPPNGLTRKEYYEGNKEHIKDMILTRVLVLDTNTKFKELKNKYSEEELAEIIGDYVEKLCSNASMEDLKNIQKNFVSLSGVEEVQALEKVIDNAIEYNKDKNKPMPAGELAGIKINQQNGIIPDYWNTDEPISFEEVYKIERGTEYSQCKIEKYALAKKEMEIVANAYNKKQQFVEFAEGLRKDETLSSDEKAQKVLEGFAAFYALSEDGGLNQLKELINKSKLPISIDENGFNFGTLDDSAKNRALNSLLKLAQQSKEAEFEEFLNGKTIEDYKNALAEAQNNAIGEENGKMMAEAMKNDNLTCIQRWTGNTSMVGMGMTVVGGILCFTPLAPLGAGMITVGNTLAIGGMVAETGLGVADYATKDVQTIEEAEQLGKNFLMNAGGFIIGMGAGKAGMKAFSKLIDEKLVAVFGKQIAAGNKAQALKTVFTNPEYLKNFMTAAGAKLSADFVISYAGDLAMMGILDTDDNWQSLLKANLTGILVGMSGDIKDVSGAGRPRNFGVSVGVKPMTEMDYGRRLLGNVVTVVDPKTGAAVEGEVTGLHNTNGHVEIEVNGQRFSTNDVTEVKREVKAPKSDVENFSKEDVTKLLKDKGFPDDLISDILSKTTKDNIEIVREMVSDKDFPREQLVYILSCTTKDNIEIAREMILDKDFPRDEIMYILSNTRKDNIEIAEDLLSDKDFPKKDICGILSKTTKDNIEVAKELISDKDFPRKDICGILSKTTKDNIEIAHALISDTSFPRDLISDVLSKTTKDNIEVARELILDKDFPRDEIMYILNNTTKDNIEIARDLISDKDFPRKDICGILSKTTKDNIEIALALISDTSFPRDLISDVLSKITKDNIEIVESGITNRNYLKTKDGTEITLDNFNRLVVLKFKGTTKKVSYSSEDSKTPNLIEIYDVKNKLNSEIHINDDCEIELDYVHGKAITKDKKSGIVTERELQQSEYPVNISFKSKFWHNLSNELEDCKSIDEIKTISDNYSSKGYNIPNYILEYSINKNITEGFSQCKTLEELNRCRDAYISKGITVPDKIYNKQYNTIIYNEIKNCQTIDDLNTFKDAYSKKGISIPEDIYNSRQNEIFSRQLDSCKTIEDLYAFKNAYLKKGITISDNIFNKKLYSIILTEIKNCKSLEDLNSLKKYYKKQPFSIPNKVFDYYSAQLTNPPLSNLEKRIKSGNEFSNDRFQKEQFNLSDSKYENNLEAVYSDMQRRIERDMGALSDTQISDIAQNISLKMQIPVEEVLEVMSRLTQFGSMKTLEKLGSELDKYNISGFYTEGGISSNSTLNYLLTKEQITLNNGSEKKAFILDDAGLKYLESLKPTDIKEFYQKVKEQKIVLIELDGTGLKIGNNYYSYTMLDGGQNLGAMTEAVLVQTQSGKSIDEVLQSDFRQRLNKIFEDTDTGENFADSFVKTVSNKYIATPQNIAAQIRPNMPDADYIKKVIETVVENTKGLTDTEKVMARSVIAKYYDYMVKIYSQDSIAELLKTRHNAIEEHVLRIGKTMDDVVYIYPVTGKSFDLVCLQYAKINGIEPGKIIQYDGTNNNKSLNGKVVVLLDDVVGSGDSMTSQQFKYEQFLYNQKNVNMLFVPITCADNGKHNIINTICMNSRSGKDFLIYDATQSSRYEDFVNLLTLEEKRILDKVIGSKGYHESGLVTGFQYMTPDNNSCLSGYLNLINLNNPTADKTLSYNDEIGNMLLQYINERGKHPPIK